MTRSTKVFELIADTQRQLEILLTEHATPDFSARVTDLAAQLQRGCRVDGDAAIASILMQAEGRYCARRMMHGAILSELLLSQTSQPEDQRRVVVCAAMTMNIATLDLQDVLYTQSSRPSREQHHETMDGKGYPAGLMGAQISRYAQVLSVAVMCVKTWWGRGVEIEPD